jgi:hypothetical protein
MVYGKLTISSLSGTHLKGGASKEQRKTYKMTHIYRNIQQNIKVSEKVRALGKSIQPPAHWYFCREYIKQNA